MITTDVIEIWINSFFLPYLIGAFVIYAIIKGIVEIFKGVN